MSEPHDTPRRVGLIVPSSNTTVETEIPRMLERAALARFTFHASRTVREDVDGERAIADIPRCVDELADAPVEVVIHAALLPSVACGHDDIEQRLRTRLDERGSTAPALGSAGALVRTLRSLDAERVALVAPYPPSITQGVIRHLRDQGFEVVDAISLSHVDDHAIGRLRPLDVCSHAARLDLRGADVLIAAASVQLPSLEAVEPLEERFGVPVVTPLTATTAELLGALGLPRRVPHAGALLAGEGALEPRPPVPPGSTARLPPIYRR